MKHHAVCAIFKGPHGVGGKHEDGPTKMCTCEPGIHMAVTDMAFFATILANLKNRVCIGETAHITKDKLIGTCLHCGITDGKHVPPGRFNTTCL